MTIREIINARRQEIGNAMALESLRASQILVELSNLTGNINDEIRACNMLYNHKLQECFEVEETANRAKIRAEATPEYLRLKEAKDLKEVVEDLKSSLKYLIREGNKEMQGYIHV